nr:MAG TPA: tail assembly chaperone protein [Caudoviricetes sp.]
MSLTQKLLQIDRGKFQKEEILEVKAKRLSEIMGEEIMLKFRALSGKEYTSIASTAVRDKGGVDYSKAYDVNALMICEALMEPSLKDKELQKHFGVASPKDLAFLFFPGMELTVLADKVTKFSGFLEEDEVKEVKN